MSPQKRSRNPNPKKFPCSGYGDCTMVFTRAEHLVRHVRKHTNEKPFECVVETCDKTFSRFDNMLQHAQTHRREMREEEENQSIGGAGGVRGARSTRAQSRRKRSLQTSPEPCEPPKTSVQNRTQSDACIDHEHLTTGLPSPMSQTSRQEPSPTGRRLSLIDICNPVNVDVYSPHTPSATTMDGHYLFPDVNAFEW
ncbi:C2H2-type zinc finger transcription factor [Phycomyces blakesleeanus]|uniref:C2H2-type zinc finger transcription factor n=2 Tax=Phycomyces blakesleeanus TaxID=4837 RepID=A0A162TPY8_PHYB8|nr:C2H2-type zinc finger transcription factor [Phycomyces blakesleeanus NRRL 1555(-)]OAD70142.1 C2H2-type zinc finger transcription factor [Phycomyces blakesleeanus NRRL 1555(-)]|eukprot:XP_018288182.1 C2H2-type zinc finger transcription factor [Phycomyces blakesleeanus NRRL 1555(-)]